MFKHWSKRTKVMGGIAAGLLVLTIGVGAYGISTGKLATQASSIGTYYIGLSNNTNCKADPTAYLYRDPDPADGSYTKIGSGNSWNKNFTLPRLTFVTLSDASTYKASIPKTNLCATTTSWRGTNVALGVCGGTAESQVQHIPDARGLYQVNGGTISNVPWGQLVKFHAVNVAPDGTHPMTGVTAKCNPSSGTVPGAATAAGSGQGYVYCLSGSTGITVTIPGGGTFDGGNSKSVQISNKCAATATQEFIRHQ